MKKMLVFPVLFMLFVSGCIPETDFELTEVRATIEVAQAAGQPIEQPVAANPISVPQSDPSLPYPGPNTPWKGEPVMGYKSPGIRDSKGRLHFDPYDFTCCRYPGDPEPYYRELRDAKQITLVDSAWFCSHLYYYQHPLSPYDTETSDGFINLHQISLDEVNLFFDRAASELADQGIPIPDDVGWPRSPTMKEMFAAYKNQRGIDCGVDVSGVEWDVPLPSDPREWFYGEDPQEEIERLRRWMQNAASAADYVGTFGMCSESYYRNEAVYYDADVYYLRIAGVPVPPDLWVRAPKWCELKGLPCEPYP